MSRDKESMARDIETSLSNLRTGYIDLYQIHNLPEKDIGKVFGPGGAYEALSEAKAAGKIAHIGVTAHSADALKILVEQYSDCLETVMFPYNIVEDQGREVLTLAREKGMGTIAMKPLAGGNLDDYALALRYIAAAGVCDILIPGMGSPEEVDRNASVDLEAPFTPKRRRPAPPSAVSWAPSSAAGATTAPPAPTASTSPAASSWPTTSVNTAWRLGQGPV